MKSDFSLFFSILFHGTPSLPCSLRQRSSSDAVKLMSRVGERVNFQRLRGFYGRAEKFLPTNLGLCGQNIRCIAVYTSSSSSFYFFFLYSFFVARD